MKTLKEYARDVEVALDKRLPEVGETRLGDMPVDLNRAMRYSLLAGGKRLRPSMLLAAVDMLGGDPQSAMPLACAVEMIHTYSLIHDDLPGMDGDVLRRGRPTNHVVFGEGQAILAGDGLLSEAFEGMLKSALAHPEQLAAVYEIARGAGARGMVAGQSLDLACERSREGGEKELVYIHENKTACMFVYPLRAAGRLCGADEQALEALGAYGRAFGHMFQVADDLLDVVGDAGALGKSVGKDASEGKLTATSVYGLDGARAQVDAFLAEGLHALRIFGDRAAFFESLIRDMRGRRS
ncbi:MAG: polyprenyl synthetase family protein [Clostridia bacterium]